MAPVIRFLPDDKSAEVRPGTTVLDAGRRARVQIRTRCGGKAGCLMCKVQVDDQSGLTPMKRNEELKLGSLKDEGIRLACQACVTGDVTVNLPEDPLKKAVRALLEKQKEDHDG